MKKLESGRSMVEMLGVLAIIGVLSVGGIAGYSLSMRRHRANQIVDLMSKFALETYSQCQQLLLNGDILSLTDCESAHLVNLHNFKNTGIGNLPAGSTDIGYSTNWPVNTNSEKNIDEVYLRVEFNDKKLCQAVASIVGSSCDKTTVYATFKQN